MTLAKYPVTTDHNHSTYEFLSEGPKGTVKKVVFYQEIEQGVFNIAFGDWDEEKQGINDNIRSNNNDRDKVLATVGSTIIDFLKNHPGVTLFARGSTPARTRLYQMAIVSNWREIKQLFEVVGFVNGNWEVFTENTNYEQFALRAK